MCQKCFACFHIFVIKNHDQHKFASRSAANHHGTQKTFVIAYVEKCESFFQRIAANFVAQFVRFTALKPAIINVEHFVELSWNVKAHSIHGVELLVFGHFLVSTPAFVRKGKFEFVAVEFRFCRANNGGDGRKFDFADTGQIVGYFLLFVCYLFVVAQHLPFAASANSEMFAHRVDAFVGIMVDGNGTRFHKVTFFAGHLQVGHIAGHHKGNKHHYIVYACDGFSFGCNIGNLYIFEYRKYFNLSCHLKFEISPCRMLFPVKI